MAYQAGDTILDDEYNTFVNSSSSPFGYNHFAGTGALQYGLGESAIATVSAGDTVQASSWNTLFTAMDTIAGHTADSLTSRSAVSAGDPIAIKAAVEADLATLAASVAAGSPNTTALTTSSTLQNPQSSSTWYGSFTTEVSATFASADAMRFFFNAGGKIRIDPIRIGNGATGGGATGKDSEWDAIYNAVGNLDIGSQATTRSESGETLTTDGLANGFHDLTTSYTTLIKISSDTYPYTANNIEIQAKLDAAVGTAITITVKTISTDGAADLTFSDASADNTAYRNGQHEHRLISINTTTGGGLANAYSPSGSSIVSNSTS
jgi:hypothetical protein